MLVISHLLFSFVCTSVNKSIQVYTTNIFTVKTAGCHCVQFPTVVSLHFLQSSRVCSGSLWSNWMEVQTYNFCSLITTVFEIQWGFDVFLKTFISTVYWMQFLKNGASIFYWWMGAVSTFSRYLTKQDFNLFIGGVPQ